MISYGLSLGNYGVNIQFSIVQCGHLVPLSILSSVKYLQHTKMKILSVISIRSYSFGRFRYPASVAERCVFYCGWGWYSENSFIVLEIGRGQSSKCECYGYLSVRLSIR